MKGIFGGRRYHDLMFDAGRGLKSQAGFTIVETLVVLSVTAGLFVVAATVIGGKQAVTAYSQGVRDMQSLVQQSINEVSSGYNYTSLPNQIRCSATMSGPDLSTTGPPVDIGMNEGCMVLGKVVQFSVGAASTTPDDFTIYPLIGLRGPTANPSLDLVSAKPKVIARGNVASTVPDDFETKRLPGGLTVIDMYYDNNPGNKIDTIAFTSTLNSLGSADTSQQVNLVAIPAMTRTGPQEQGVDIINANIGAGIINPPKGVQICFGGGPNRSALMTIGAKGRVGIVESQIKLSVDCT